METLLNRYPRLVRALRASGFSVCECASAINARKINDDFAAAEAICFVGGASKAIRHAINYARLRRAYGLN